MTERCIECSEPADWVRSTQFAGDHPYCDRHARMEKDFDDEPDSYSYWWKIVRDDCDNWKPNKDII